MPDTVHCRLIPGGTIEESLRVDAEGPFVCSLDGEPWPCTFTQDIVPWCDIVIEED